MNNDKRSLFQMNPAMRFVIFFIMTGISLLLGVMISFSVVAFVLGIPFSSLPTALLAPQNAKIALAANAIAAIISFLIPSWAVGFFAKGNIAHNMGFNKIGGLYKVLIVVVLAFSGLALSGALATATELIPIPKDWNDWAVALEESYKKAIAIKPDYAEAHSNLGNTLHQLGRLEDAKTSYNKAIAIKPDYVEAHSNRGNALRALKRPVEALASYDRALGIRPDDAQVLSNRGNALQDLKRPEEALESFDHALKIRPDFSEALNNRGKALWDLRRPAEALGSYERALQIKPDFAGAWIR